MATSRSRTLAALLSEAVADSKHTQRSLGKIMGVSHVTIGRWLRGETAVDPETAATLLAHLGITGDKREEILSLARKSDERDWLVTGAGAGAILTGMMHLERRAVTMVDWAPLTLPGLLQTADYARAILNASGVIPREEAEHRVIYRLSRRDAIQRVNPLRLTALLGMPAIMARIGGTAIMRDQLQHLVNMSRSSVVNIQIVPDSEQWHGGLVGPFIFYELPDEPAVVHLEHHRSGVFLDDPHNVADYKTLADQLCQRAMSAEETVELIKTRLESQEMQ